MNNYWIKKHERTWNKCIFYMVFGIMIWTIIIVNCN